MRRRVIHTMHLMNKHIININPLIFIIQEEYPLIRAVIKLISSTQKTGYWREISGIYVKNDETDSGAS